MPAASIPFMKEEISQEVLHDCIERMLHAEARAPRSTYRLQLHAGFKFGDAEAVLPYLRRLGISDCYVSPLFEARPGSMHGYDITRHDRINPELGGEEGFARFSGALREAEMGLVLDIVPNHMGVGNDSVWWQDVLENGRTSEYAEFFDIDWEPLKEDMRGKLLLPILGDQYGSELENGRILIAIENGVGKVKYYDHMMPMAPRSLPLLFPEEQMEELPENLREMLRDLTHHIPPNDTEDSGLASQRREQLEEIQPRIRRALAKPENQDAIAAALKKVNGTVGDPRSFDRLH